MEKHYKYKYIKLKEIKGTREENIYIIALGNGLFIGVIIMYIIILTNLL